MPSTKAVQVALIAPFAALPTYVGSWYVWGDPARFSSPAFDAAKKLAPMGTWGAVSLALAAAVLVGMAIRWRSGDAHFLAVALTLAGTYYAFWAIVSAANAAQTATASPTAAVFIALAAIGNFVAGLQTARRMDGW